MKLLKTIRSKINPLDVYGKSGEEVKLISDLGSTLIVSGENGNRFPVSRDDVSDDTKAALKKDDPLPVKQVAPKKGKSSKMTSDDKPSLF